MKMSYTPERIRFLKKNMKGKLYVDLTNIFNDFFKTHFSVRQIKQCCKQYSLKTGMRGRSLLPVGTERIFDKKLGVTWVKISMKGKTIYNTGKWKPKHHVLWEKEYGPIPDGSIIIFLDQDTKNITIDNLAMVTRREFSSMVRNNYLSENQAITKLNIALVKHRLAMIDAIKRLTGNQKSVAADAKYRRYKQKAGKQ